MMFTKYSKLIVAILGAAGIGLETAYPGQQWSQFATAIGSAFLVYLVPNGGNTPKDQGPTP